MLIRVPQQFNQLLIAELAKSLREQLLHLCDPIGLALMSRLVDHRLDVAVGVGPPAAAPVAEVQPAVVAPGDVRDRAALGLELAVFDDAEETDGAVPAR